MKTMAYRQRGISFMGVFVLAVAIIFIAIMAMKMVPAYTRSAQIAQIFKEIARDPIMQNAPIKDIKDSYNKRASMNYITDVSADDIDINKDSGQLSLSISYSVKIPVAGNVSLLLDFNPSSS